MSSEYGARFDVPRLRRFGARGVPIIELRVSGPTGVFHRVAGICDSGASRTLLSHTTYERLGYVLPADAEWFPTNALTRQIFYVRQPLHLRIPVTTGPPVHIVVMGGLTPDIEENLFGVDVIEYFAVLLTEDRVTFLGDRRT